MRNIITAVLLGAIVASADSKTPRDECDLLLSKLMPFAEQQLNKRGEFLPFAGAMQVDGSIALVATLEGSESNSEKLIAQLVLALQSGAKAKTYKATGLANDMRVVPPGSTEKTDAVAVRLDHVSGYSVIFVIPYKRSASREVKFSAPYATKGAAEIFR